MPAVNLFKTEFTSTISVLHLHAGTGRYGGSGGSGGIVSYEEQREATSIQP